MTAILGQPRVLDVRPGQSPAPSFTFELGDDAIGAVAVVIRLRFRWLERLALWTMRIESPDGTEITPDLHLRPGARIPWSNTQANVPEGSLIVLGPDDYRRESLGDTLRIVYVPRKRNTDPGDYVAGVP